jgi:hypothetical protein
VAWAPCETKREIHRAPATYQVNVTHCLSISGRLRHLDLIDEDDPAAAECIF